MNFKTEKKMFSEIGIGVDFYEEHGHFKKIDRDSYIRLKGFSRTHSFHKDFPVYIKIPKEPVFRDLKIGDKFKHSSYIYLKTDRIYTSYLSQSLNAVCISGENIGKLYNFVDNCTVERL